MAANPPRVVKVIEIDATRHATDEAMRYTGVVRARTESNLGFRVTGKIAERLVISERTADNHLQHILNKLDLPSRSHLAAWVLERRPARDEISTHE